MIELLIPLALGLVFGSICGLIPGLHPNNLIIFVPMILLLFDPLPAAILLLTAGVVNSFVSMIPSILLGAPEDAEVLGVLPGHRLLMEGRGYEAIKLTVVGSLGGMLFALLSLPLFFFIIPPVYEFIKPLTHWLLILVVSYMIFTENSMKNKIFAFMIVIMSGALGMISLNYSDTMIFPLLSSLFGLPILLSSIFKKTSLPKKFTEAEDKIEKKRLFTSISTGSFAGIITGLLPGVGSAQATILAQKVSGKGDGRDFLMSIGAVTTSNVIYSILALWLIGKARSGIAIAVGEIITIDFEYVLIFLATIVIASAFASIATLKLTKPTLFLLKKIDYKTINIATILLMLTMIFFFAGIMGLFVALIGISIGLIPNYIEVKRTHCMGCLVVPIIIYYLSASL
ncbi:MAG: hypothetical protein GOV02_04470 [Candidatus Aenigmarchaeota archaeon]|nr:hypothetical protein [Candidatus Aenigmarchaeota archaeon]